MPLTNEEMSLLDEIDGPGRILVVAEEDHLKFTSHHQSLQPGVLELLERHISALTPKLTEPLSRVRMDPKSTLTPDESVAVYQFQELTDAMEYLQELGGSSVGGGNNQQTPWQRQPEEETNRVYTQETGLYQSQNHTEEVLGDNRPGEDDVMTEDIDEGIEMTDD
ncbi:hypothetical protein M231_02126 [Tremella mesenterica]|uniref:Uncharacterized protein n=1 Tax=Tremella mesenterica TaxID=5217 RepID=A0A4Q1BRR9_TREME|nr:hypothetical protein M231_02126 [Tremella mesenterica]